MDLDSLFNKGINYVKSRFQADSSHTASDGESGADGVSYPNAVEVLKQFLPNTTANSNLRPTTRTSQEVSTDTTSTFKVGISWPTPIVMAAWKCYIPESSTFRHAISTLCEACATLATLQIPASNIRMRTGRRTVK